jgi:hypothetical protein
MDVWTSSPIDISSKPKPATNAELETLALIATLPEWQIESIKTVMTDWKIWRKSGKMLCDQMGLGKSGNFTHTIATT